MRQEQMHRRYFKSNFVLGEEYKTKKAKYLEECAKFEHKTQVYLFPEEYI
jgi:hypothetical protein